MEMQLVSFRDVTPCSDVVGYERFGGPSCLHFQGEDGGNVTTEKAITRIIAVISFKYMNARPSLV